MRAGAALAPGKTLLPCRSMASPVARSLGSWRLRSRRIGATITEDPPLGGKFESVWRRLLYDG